MKRRVILFCYLFAGVAIPHMAHCADKKTTPKVDISKSAFSATQNELKKRTNNAFKAGEMLPFVLDTGDESQDTRFNSDFIHGSGMDSSLQTFGISAPINPIKNGNKFKMPPKMERHFNGEEPIDTSDDMPNILFESCMRFQLNSGAKTKQAMSVCQALNPGHDDSDEHKGDHSVVHESHDLEIENTTYFHAGKKDDADTPSMPSETETARIVASTSLAPTPSTPLSDGDDSDCDVSKDLRVMLSARCLKKADNFILGHVDNTQAEASTTGGPLHIPKGLTPAEPQPLAGHHSLFANVPVYKGAASAVPGLTGNDIDYTASGHKGQSSRAALNRNTPDKPGDITCIWSYSIAGVPSAMRTGTIRGIDIRSCIRDSLKKSSDMSDGVITSITLQNRVTLRRDMVECHRHNGHDICKPL